MILHHLYLPEAPWPIRYGHATNIFSTMARPKRILALDGGGLRGILTLSYLGEIESVLRERHGGSKDFRLITTST